MFKMEKFKVLKHNGYALVKVGIYSTQKDYNVFSNSFVPYYFLIIVLTFLMSGSVFVFLLASDFSKALRTGTYMVGMCQCYGMYFSYAINASNLQTLHFKLQKNVDQTFEGT